ncbi:MAG: hypothetical protein RLZZ214_2761 [Verrucomicrobiota bacterium]
MVLTAPIFIRSRRIEGVTEEVNNARQIGLALDEFKSQYGVYPDAATATRIRSETKTTLNLGTTSSNDFFRQLLVANITQSERMFYVKGSGVRKPDNVIAGAKALEKGECGFTYFLGATKQGNPSRPLAAAPMIPGTDRFDPKPFKGKAVCLRIDNSVTSLPIDKDGHVILHGRNLMDPHHPIWEGHAPVIAWPDL